MINSKLLFITASILGALIFIFLFGNITGSVGPFEIEMDVGFGKGITEAVIPPVGKIRAFTHFPPLKVIIKLNNINIYELEKLINITLNYRQILTEYRSELMAFLKLFVIKLVVLGGVGGCFTVFVLNFKTLRLCLGAGLIGVLVVSILIITAFYSYDVQAFEDPEYIGIIKGAPWMLGMAEEAISKVDKLGNKLQVMAKNMYQLFEKIDKLEPITQQNKIKVLHVSDIHNNPAALDFIHEIVRSFNVDVIIDTGDITDYGTPLEAQLLERINGFKTPYIFVPGNHDSPEIIQKMKTIDNVFVLDKTSITIKNISIYGAADPSSKGNHITPQADYDLKQYAEEIEQNIKNQKPVDVLAFHNPKMGEGFARYAPIILTGHTHALGMQKQDDTIIINAGTTGAAGLRGLQASKDIPYSVVLLYFSENRVPLAADIIKVYNIKQGLILERVVFDENEKEG